MRSSLLLIFLLLVPALATGTEQPASLSPRIAEISAVIETARAQVEDLSAQSREAVSPEEARRLQGEIMRIKRESHLEVLAIQLRYAEQEGRTGDAEELRQTIERMTAPQPAGESQPRPTPADR